MNFEFAHLLPDNFSPKSKVWIYQSSRPLMISEALDLEELLQKFCAEWRSHGDKVTAYGNLFFGQFLVLMADETDVSVGGCSTDSSVRFVKALEQQFGVNFFDRSSLTFIIKNKIEVLPLNQLQYALDNGFITPDTLYFNNTVQTREELEKGWIIPVKDSWLARKLKVNTPT
jgi:hypothetical protein